MPIYISRGKFTTDAVKGMLAKPENREEAVANLFKSCGGKLIGWYLTFGHHDWLVIGEFPDEKAAATSPPSSAARFASSAKRVGFCVREYSKPLCSPGPSCT